MTPFERNSIGIVGVLALTLVGVTLANPPAGVTVAPDARLDTAPKSATNRGERVSFLGITYGFGNSFPLVERLPLESAQLSYVLNVSHPTTQKVTDVFDNLGYDLQSVIAGREEVPRLFLASMPADLLKVREIRLKKRIFFKSVLPLILQVNEEILVDRRRLWTLRAQMKLGQRIKAADRLWLIVMAERYKVKQGNMDEILHRVDVIAPSLALAQAAAESGWGTSRFAREGNAIFGEWTFSRTNALTPRARDEGKTHAIRAFPSLLDSVRSYAFNLNTHRAYRKLRVSRSAMRRNGEPIEGMVLASGLLSYSERGAEYVEIIRSIIDANNLHRLDDARLRGQTSAI